MWAQQGVRCHCFYITNVDPASHRRRLARFLPRAILDRAPAGVRSPRVGVKLLIKELERARDFGSGSFLLLISAAFPFKMPPLPPGATLLPPLEHSGRLCWRWLGFTVTTMQWRGPSLVVQLWSQLPGPAPCPGDSKACHQPGIFGEALTCRVITQVLHWGTRHHPHFPLDWNKYFKIKGKKILP